MDSLPRPPAPLRIRLVHDDTGPRVEIGQADQWIDLVSAGVDDFAIRLTAEGMFVTIFARGDLLELDFPVHEVLTEREALVVDGLTSEELDGVILGAEFGQSPGSAVRAHLLNLMRG